MCAAKFTSVYHSVPGFSAITGAFGAVRFALPRPLPSCFVDLTLDPRVRHGPRVCCPTKVV